MQQISTARLVTRLLALISCAAIAIGCGGRKRRTPDDTLVILIESRLNNLDPRYCESNHDVKLSRLVAPGLTTVEQPSLEPKLLLAESVTRVSDRVVDVVLKPGLKFSDGSPLTARDVAFSYNSAIDPAMKAGVLKGFRQRFERVEVLDERRARFHLVDTVATLMSDFEFGIISEKASADHGGRFPGGVIIGAGPYAIESFHPEDVRLVRNPHWPFEQPRMDKVRARAVTDGNARALMLAGGSADLAQNAVRIDLVDDLVQRDRLHLERGPSSILTYFMMNNSDPILDDVRVRRAIAHALDRERVLRSKLDGNAVLATGLIWPGHWSYEPNVPTYDYDPKRAMELLDEAGFPDPDGPGGAPRMSLVYKTSSDQFRLSLARVWAAQMGEVGIAVEVQSFEAQTFFTDVKKGNFQLASMQTAAITEPDYLYTYFHSDRIPSEADRNAHNRWRFIDKRFDELTVEGRRVSDDARRKQLYGEAQRILAEQLPVIPLWHEDNLAVMNKDVSGYRLYPTASLWGLIYTDKQR